MGVWNHLGNPEEMAQLLQHPSHDAVTARIATLIAEVRAASGLGGLRPVQERLAAALVDAESQFRQQSRQSKRGEGSPVDLTFWRRACVQLRAVGDAIAWRFLGYRRQWIVLMGRNQRPGLMSDKAGFDTEWQLFTEHWDAGEPTLLAGLTNCITLGDLLVARDNVLWTIEAKRNLSNVRARQMGRLRDLQRQLSGDPRVNGPDGASWVVESAVPLASYWTSAEPHLVRAVNEGIASWVPTTGVGVMFTAWRAGATLGQDKWMAALEQEQQRARAQMGQGQYGIIARSHEYPYRPNRAVPFSILPLAPELAAMLLTSDALFVVEVHVERLMDALRDAGLEPRNLLVDQPDRRPLPPDLIEWRSGSSKGTVHSGAIEQVAIELTDLSAWASALATSSAPSADARRWGTYICLADEGEVWA
jgi:hypothetical protein